MIESPILLKPRHQHALVTSLYHFLIALVITYIRVSCRQNRRINDMQLLLPHHWYSLWVGEAGNHSVCNAHKIIYNFLYFFFFWENKRTAILYSSQLMWHAQSILKSFFLKKKKKKQMLIKHVISTELVCWENPVRVRIHEEITLRIDKHFWVVQRVPPIAFL